MFETYFILPFLTAHHEFDISQIIGNSQGIQSVWGMGLWQSTLCPASLWCCFALLGRSSLRGSGKGWPFGVWDDEVIGSGRENKSCSIWLSRISFSIIFHLNHNCWKIIIIPIILNTIHFLRIQKPLHLISSYFLLGERCLQNHHGSLISGRFSTAWTNSGSISTRKAAGWTAESSWMHCDAPWTNWLRTDLGGWGWLPQDQLLVVFVLFWFIQKSFSTPVPPFNRFKNGPFFLLEEMGLWPKFAQKFNRWCLASILSLVNIPTPATVLGFRRRTPVGMTSMIR